MKILRRFSNNEEWSDTTIVTHHYEAINNAIEYFNNNNTYIYTYDDNKGIKYNLIPIQNENIFLQIKTDNTTSYLKYIRKRYIKQKSNNIITVPYCNNSITINKGEKYYYDNKYNKIVIGWHGSYNEPLDMDGNNIINEDEWF